MHAVRSIIVIMENSCCWKHNNYAGKVICNLWTHLDQLPLWFHPECFLLVKRLLIIYMIHHKKGFVRHPWLKYLFYILSYSLQQYYLQIPFSLEETSPLFYFLHVDPSKSQNHPKIYGSCENVPDLPIYLVGFWVHSCSLVDFLRPQLSVSSYTHYGILQLYSRILWEDWFFYIEYKI